MDQQQPNSPAEAIRHESLSALSGVSHGFFTRNGGVSEGVYASLNAGSGSDDAPEKIVENRTLIAASLGANVSVSTPWQVHSAEAMIVDAPLGDERPKADALVTATTGVPIGVLSADCGPILFADQEAGVIGAAHAGWRGALDGIVASTVAAMEKLGAKRGRIVAVLGPSIRQPAYEVGPEFVARFTETDATNSQWFAPSGKPDHARFDLAGFTLARLREAGVKAYALPDCTYADEERFYSYRRMTHRGEPDYGRQISAIMLTA